MEREVSDDFHHRWICAKNKDGSKYLLIQPITGQQIELNANQFDTLFESMLHWAKKTEEALEDIQ